MKLLLCTSASQLLWKNSNKSWYGLTVSATNFSYAQCAPAVILSELPFILSTNSSGVSISILEKPNHFLPKSLMDGTYMIYIIVYAKEAVMR